MNNFDVSNQKITNIQAELGELEKGLDKITDQNYQDELKKLDKVSSAVSELQSTTWQFKNNILTPLESKPDVSAEFRKIESLNELDSKIKTLRVNILFKVGRQTEAIAEMEAIMQLILEQSNFITKNLIEMNEAYIRSLKNKSPFNP